MKAQLIITIEDDGSCNVNGPIKEKMIAYGMLEAAKDAIQEFHQNKAKSQIQLVPAGAIPSVKS